MRHLCQTWTYGGTNLGSFNTFECLGGSALKDSQLWINIFSLVAQIGCFANCERIKLKVQGCSMMWNTQIAQCRKLDNCGYRY